MERISHAHRLHAFVIEKVAGRSEQVGALIATALRYPFIENDRINMHGRAKLPEAAAVIVVGVRDDDAIDMADVILRKTRKKSIRFVPRVYQRGLPVALNEKCVTLTDIEHRDARSGK